MKEKAKEVNCDQVTIEVTAATTSAQKEAISLCCKFHDLQYAPNCA